MIQAHTENINPLSYSSDGCLIASGSGDDTAKGTELQRFQCHEETISEAAFLADGKKLVTASWDDTIKVWNSTTGAELLALKGLTDDVQCMAISRVEKILVTGSADRTTRCWDTVTGKVIFATPHQKEPISKVAITADGKYIAFNLSGTVTIMLVR